MDKKYSPFELEKKIYEKWMKNDCFSPKEFKSNYSIVLPPPNVTGTLHMGHAFQHTIIDILIRYNRMLGKSVLWQPGTDHAGIATQIVVENNLKQEGKTRESLTRNNFVKEVWKWKEKSGNTIINQTKRIGSSADWNRNRFTMDDGLSDAVRKVFIELYDKKIIYRKNKLINWDIKLQTAISDLEVSNIEKEGLLFFINYDVVDSKEKITVATTRPETLFGDTAICINTKDERYRHLANKFIEIPFINRKVPIIQDESIDMTFGTGCVKITPGHDFNDYKLGEKHKLKIINILNKDGTLNSKVTKDLIGINIHDARKLVLKKLEKEKRLVKKDKYKTSIPVGDRSGEIIEPLLTDQWFMKMDNLAEPAIKAVKDGHIKFMPKNWEKVYFNWLENIEDWCISRQIWWGHRIPAWFDAKGNIYVADNEDQVRKKYNLDKKLKLTQDQDVLDTWFSSALWPFTTLGWPEETNEFKKYYPTNVLVTGFDIIFFWVARMVMMGLKFTNKIPFKTIYIHGLVRDSEGKKMSKSLGNIIDPIDIIDGINLKPLIDKRTTNLVQPKFKEKIIKKTKIEFPNGIKPYGADALRFCFGALASTGRDINFDLNRIEGYRNFCNKLWNASRFVFMTVDLKEYNQKINYESLSLYDKWVLSRLNDIIADYKKHFSNFRFDLVSGSLYSFIWYEYCDWYLEIAKIMIARGVDSTKDTLINSLQLILKLCHPIIPYITEEIWEEMHKRNYVNDELLINSKFPSQQKLFIDNTVSKDVNTVMKIINSIRKTRSDLNIHPKMEIDVYFLSNEMSYEKIIKENNFIIQNLAKVNNIFWNEKSYVIKDCITITLKDLKALIPIKKIINVDQEVARLEKNLNQLQNLLDKVQHKLNNKDFIEKAPSSIIKENLDKKENIQKEIISINELMNYLSD